ncbi:F-box only protein 16 isoform X1 [Chiloscyllium plagiosum]|uniref:F-box only protein 16 isoform X1 n=1 Tax=Chiloscyllium plagiosum TaxID=36176 RepID=UPI001CB8658B|nr:F-box only protein 16 isoform X1 [Chiloscyllium plagiosum]XP_043536300.1 F-box only protein 16 isoform X1 [Chiloscyllium plagiosum]XP_043536309.1 F-box only protein 16 isoform X1 [Chiloscyllium plagiosum]
MAFAPSKIMNGPKMQTKMSTWTPLNHQPTNDKVFEERGELLGKWFDKWTDTQRRKILLNLFERCSVSQLKFCEQHLRSRVPVEALDLACFLPRVLTLYIFSFLDPRSLCRCAQVSWHWKDLAELDQLWMPKCLRLGWYISFTPTIYEQRIWKRHYIEMVKELNVTKPTTPPSDEFIVVDVHPLPKDPVDQKQLRMTSARPQPGKVQLEHPPWRDSDRHPTDTIRFNYLDNCEPIGEARKKGGGTTPTLGQQARERMKHPSANYKMRKAKSLMSMSLDFNANQLRQVRPLWACQSAMGDFSSKEEVKARTQSSDWNAGIRPAPVRSAIQTMSEKGQKASLRTQRSVPSCPLFESQPWQIPASKRDSDEEE